MNAPTDTATLCVPADHPSLAGHFPGRPIVPAVVILDAVLSAARQGRPDLRARRLLHAKFPHPLRPGCRATILLEWSGAALHFNVAAGSESVSIGVFDCGGEPEN